MTRLFSMELKIYHNNGVEKILEKGEIIFEQSN